MTNTMLYLSLIHISAAIETGDKKVLLTESDSGYSAEFDNGKIEFSRSKMCIRDRPITAVSTEMGISAAVALRATVSTIIIKALDFTIFTALSSTKHAGSTALFYFMYPLTQMAP